MVAELTDLNRNLMLSIEMCIRDRLYCLLRDKNTRAGDAPVDIIARAEDASKIQRICDRFELGKIDKASDSSPAYGLSSTNGTNPIDEDMYFAAESG